MLHIATAEIGIDAGHRVALHDSKCKNMHGHRYRIIAEVSTHALGQGSETGMVMDFGFIKEEMTRVIDQQCDHTFIWDYKDPWLIRMLGNKVPEEVEVNILRTGGQRIYGELGFFYLVPFTPTAENLCRHWGELLIPRIAARTDKRARLHRLTVFETPNHSAIVDFQDAFQFGKRFHEFS